MGKKKGKKDIEKKAALAARKEAKQEKSARKRIAKQQGASFEEEQEDLDKVLQAYKRRDEASTTAIPDKPTLDPLETDFPLPRANATLCDVEGEKRDHLYLFGGEYFDGISNVVLDDLLRFEPQKKEWKQVTTHPRPASRCAHSCVSYKQSLYVFGGELATSEQYHHYRDMWKFDTNTLKWTEITAKNPPSARSGHVCYVWKNYMVLFGGFYEALRETRWYNDIHVFNLQTETWMDVPQSRLSVKPEPRSACNIANFGADKIIIHGGFSKIKTSNTAAETKVHSDSWILHLAPLLQQKAPTWERWTSSSKGVSAMSPNGRAGTTSVSYKSRMIVFGGVVDSEQHHHKVDSIFYNDLMAMDIERRKWFPLKVKDKSSAAGGRRRRKEKADDDISEAKVEESKEEEEEEIFAIDEDEVENEDGIGQHGWDLDMLRSNMFAFVDGDGNIVYEKIEDDDEERKDCEEKDDDENDEDEEEKEEEKEDEGEEEEEEQKVDTHLSDSTPAKKNPEQGSKVITSSSVMTINPENNTPEAVARNEPLPRINASVVVCGHIMYVFGGILEVGDREVTLDDMWSLDLRKRDSWECIWQGTMHKQVWRGAAFDDDDSYISTGKEGESDDDFDDGDSETDSDENDGIGSSDKKSAKKNRRAGLRQEITDLNEKYGLGDQDRTPANTESLADFYSRTAAYWNNEAVTQISSDANELSQKELKREGFKLAQARYEELKPVLDRLEALVPSKERKDKKAEKKEKKEKKKKKSSKK